MADRRRNLGIPSGVVFPFAGTSAPYGYLICNGSAISRADYPALFAALGTSHGQGDGLTTFNLPDYRGRFMRGVDGTAGNDPDKTSRTAIATGGNTGDAVGSVQGHSFQTHDHAASSANDTHTHTLSGATSTRDAAGAPGNYLQSDNISGGSLALIPSYVQSDTHNHTITVTSKAASGANSQASANETRPVNVSVNYIIKV